MFIEISLLSRLSNVDTSTGSRVCSHSVGSDAALRVQSPAAWMALNVIVVRDRTMPGMSSSPSFR